MKKLISILALLCALPAVAQNITYKQLVPVSNYIDSVYSIANRKMDQTNGAMVGTMTFGYFTGGGSPFWRLNTTNSPDPVFGVSAGDGWGMFGELNQTFIGYNYGVNTFYVGDSSLSVRLRGYETVITGNGYTLGDAYFSGNTYLSGSAFDALGDRFITTVGGSNNVRVFAGSGVTVAAATVSANVLGYTINAVGGSGASNAVNLVTTNNGIVSSGTTGLALTNSADISVAAYSNAQTAFVAFSITPAFKLQFTNLVTDATNTLAYFVQPASANLSNWSTLPTNAILAAASNRVVVLAGSNATVTMTSTNGTNFYTVASTATGSNTTGVVPTGSSFTNPAFYLDSTATTYQFRGRPVSTYSQTMLFRSPGPGDNAQIPQRMSWSFNDTTTASWSFNISTQYFVFNNNAPGIGGADGKYVFFADHALNVISNGNFYSDIWNLGVSHFKSNVDMGTKAITNLSGVQNFVHNGLLSTNGAANSQITVNFYTNKYYFRITNNVSVTNFSGLAPTTGSDVTIVLEPTLVNRSIYYPLLGQGTPVQGIYCHTNANAPMWTTLTNGRKYALTISAYGTNTFWAITEWK